jgi:hypothetical protein
LVVGPEENSFLIVVVLEVSKWYFLLPTTLPSTKDQPSSSRKRKNVAISQLRKLDCQRSCCNQEFIRSKIYEFESKV